MTDFINDQISNVFEINSKFDKGKGYVHYSIVRGSRGILKTLLEHGAKVDLVDDEGRSGLHDAIISGYFPLVKILVDKGANTDIQDIYGRTALHYASLCSKLIFEVYNTKDRQEMGFFLLCKNAKPNILDNYKMTPLDYA